MVRRRSPHVVLAISALAVLAVGCASPSAPPASPNVSSPGHTTSADPVSTNQPAASPFASLSGYLASRAGVITAAVYDARTKHLWLYHPGVLEYTASIVKVEIMGAAMREAEQKGEPIPSGQATLMVPMIEASDNNAATALLADVGGPAGVLRFDRAAGLNDTTPHSAAPIPGSGVPGWPGWGLTTTTASDEVTLVKRFAFQNSVLSNANRQHGLILMEHVEAGQNWGVTGGVPADIPVALKNGWIQFPQALRYTKADGWQIDSIGWVDGHGRNYVIAVLTRNNPSEQYGQDTIEAISSRIYALLGR
jgi:beta-lactamase class A